MLCNGNSLRAVIANQEQLDHVKLLKFIINLDFYRRTY